ncbi:hypothetical protein SAMN04244548_05357 [Paracoccus pantotrophus]|nr:hypothetical protein SAMN04244548_05357 [Paracoccus pantotrophus]
MACAQLRRADPTGTVSTLRTVLAVAAAGGQEWHAYETVHGQCDADYGLVAHQLQQLAKAHSDAPALVEIRSANDRRYREVRLSSFGLLQFQAFLPSSAHLTEPFGSRDQAILTGHIRDRILPVIHLILEDAPTISLGALTALLHVCLYQDRFAYAGEPTKILTEELGLNNLPRHLAALGDGWQKKTPGFGLIKLRPHPHDRRVKLPELTHRGHDLISRIAAHLLGEQRIVPRRPKAECLAELESPSQVEALPPEDFEPIKPSPTVL